MDKFQGEHRAYILTKCFGFQILGSVSTQQKWRSYEKEYLQAEDVKTKPGKGRN